jgi:hypothetical protein
MRFQLTQAICLPQVRYRAGTIVTDQIVTNLLPVSERGDQYWPGLSAATMGPGMVPLDAAAVTAKASSVYANEIIRCCATGVDSSDG